MRKEEIPDKSRTIPIDPNLPKWVCQNCHHSLTIVGVDSYAGKFFNDPPPSATQGSSIHGANSVLGSTRMDNSFVVLPRHKPPQSQGIPPRPRGASSPQPDATQSGKAMEESFVVVYKSEPVSDSGGSHNLSLEVGQNGPLHSNTSGFNATINVLTRAFDIARTQTQVS
jgi:beclin 1